MVITSSTRTHVKSIKATCRRGDRSTKLSYAPMNGDGYHVHRQNACEID